MSPTEYWKTHPDSIWLYDPNFSLAIVGTVLYAIPMLLQFWQTVFKYKAYVQVALPLRHWDIEHYLTPRSSSYFSVVFFGALLEVAGYAARAASIKKYTSIPPYAISSSFIVIAPLFVGAGDYLLISRLCLRVLRAHNTHIFKMPVPKLTRIFVICDIFTLLVQISGSGIASSNNWEGDMVKIGENVLIGGLALQLATFSFFLAIVAKFHFLTTGPEGVSPGAGKGWRQILCAVYISSSMIIIRCVYRLVEFALGIFGYPFTHEWMFYTLEAIPMLPAIIVFCVWHPGKYFGAGGRRGGKGPKSFSEIPLESSGGLRD